MIRVALRNLYRTPGFALTAILTLALGIGLSTAVFTVADALLLRRLPVQNQDRLVVLWGETRDRSFTNYPLGLADAASSLGAHEPSSGSRSSLTTAPFRSRSTMETRSRVYASRSYRAGSSTFWEYDPHWAVR